LAEVANALVCGLGAETLDPTVTDITYPDAEHRALAGEAQCLLKTEEQTRVALQRLHLCVRRSKVSALGQLIVDLMALQTDKHIHVLRLVAKRIENC
jgi:hypothetical protein